MSGSAMGIEKAIRVTQFVCVGGVASSRVVREGPSEDVTSE